MNKPADKSEMQKSGWRPTHDRWQSITHKEQSKPEITITDYIKSVKRHGSTDISMERERKLKGYVYGSNKQWLNVNGHTVIIKISQIYKNIAAWQTVWDQELN